MVIDYGLYYGLKVPYNGQIVNSLTDENENARNKIKKFKKRLEMF